MKKITLIVVLFACLIAFSTDVARAQVIGLEAWCIAQGQEWNAATKTCTITGAAYVDSGEILTIVPEETIHIGSYSLFRNSGTKLYNRNILNNDGGLNIRFDSIFYGYHGTINNLVNGTINCETDIEEGEINNHGTIYIGGRIEGSTINNYGSVTVDIYGTLNVFDNFLENYGDLFIIGSIGLDWEGIVNNNGTITNSGSIDNAGIITNSGLIYNAGIMTNNGIINNDGAITNNGTIENHGIINNQETGIINNHHGIIENYGPINNYGTFIYGTINNHGDGIFNNYGTIVTFDEYIFLAFVIQ